MNENFDPIDSLVSEVKRNTRFLEKMFFPKVGVLIGVGVFLAALVIFLK